MPKPPRTSGGQRRYGEVLLRRLLFIRRARDLGFESEDSRGLLDLAGRPDQSCASVDGLAKAHLVSIEDKIARADGTQGGGQSHAQSVRQGAHSPVQSDRCPGSLFGLIDRGSLDGTTRKTSAVERLSLESVINRRSADVAVRTALLAVRRSCDYQASYLGPSIAPARCGQTPRVIKAAARLGGATVGAAGHSA